MRPSHVRIGTWAPLARIGAALALAAPGLGACHSVAPAAPAPAESGPVPAATPYIDGHVHLDAADPAGSVRTAVAALGRQNAAMLLVQIPPDVFDHPGRFDAEVFLPEVKKHPGQIATLGGGGTLNAMIMRSVAT